MVSTKSTSNCNLIDECHFYLSTRLQGTIYWKTVIVQMLACLMYGQGGHFCLYQLP
jgi:hypothetical protein